METLQHQNESEWPTQTTLKMSNPGSAVGTLTIPAKGKKAAAAGKTYDPFSDQVHEIENLKKADALARLTELEDRGSETYFALGGVLALIRDKGWYAPQPSFDKWVEANTSMRRSKAHSLARVYNALVNAECPFRNFLIPMSLL